jgi:hypothetical protein
VVSFLDVLPRMTEREWMAQVVRYAKLMGWKAWHDAATNRRRRCASCGAWSAGARNPAGLPDLILVRRPRLVWVELKADRGALSDAQREWIESLRACGQECYVWKPKDWSQVERILA